MKYTIQERWCGKEGKRLYGLLYLPERPSPAPLVIYSHGYGSNHSRGEYYAKQLASKGAAVYAFDFRGGGPESRSEGTTRDMSVATEKDDLECVLNEARSWPEVDPDRIAFLGASQGGLVSAMAADDCPAEVKCLILLYPAFVIPRDAHRRFGAKENVPRTYTHRHDFPLSARYALDTWDYDPYASHAYPGPVLIIQGTADEVVPEESSRRAKETYRDAQLVLLEGAGHGFRDKYLDKACGLIENFLEMLHFFSDVEE